MGRRVPTTATPTVTPKPTGGGGNEGDGYGGGGSDGGGYGGNGGKGDGEGNNYSGAIIIWDYIKGVIEFFDAKVVCLGMLLLWTYFMFKGKLNS